MTSGWRRTGGGGVLDSVDGAALSLAVGDLTDAELEAVEGFAAAKLEAVAEGPLVDLLEGGGCLTANG